jgi:hypothetical protein
MDQLLKQVLENFTHFFGAYLKVINLRCIVSKVLGTGKRKKRLAYFTRKI